MKKILILLLVAFLTLNVYSQSEQIKIPEKDTTFLYIGDSLNSVGEDIIEIGSILKETYTEVGFVGFVRIYKYIIIIVLIFLFLWILSARGKNSNE